MNFPLFAAQRMYGQEENKRRMSRPAVMIATLGVAVGLAVMIVSVCVVLGFKHSIRDKVVGFGSHITVADWMTLQTAEQYPIQVGDSLIHVLKSIPGVSHAQRYALKQGILKTEKDFLGIMLKGIGPEYDTKFIKTHLKEGTLPAFSDIKGSQKIVISQTMASRLKVGCGDKLFAYFINEQGVRTRRFTIVGIYETSLKQVDDAICITDIYTVNRLNGWEKDQFSGAELSVKDFEQLPYVFNLVLNKVNRTLDSYGGTYSAQTIIEMNPQIFSWLDLMDLNVWVILALMLAVAGVTIVSGLLIIILERTQTIGLLKALGSNNSQIRHTFLWLALMIVGKGLLIGNILGIGIVILQKETGIVSLDPSKYYVETVPVEINWLLLVALNIATLIVCLLMLVAPSYLVSHIHPARSMQFE